MRQATTFYERKVEDLSNLLAKGIFRNFRDWLAIKITFDVTSRNHKYAETPWKAAPRYGGVESIYQIKCAARHER